MKMFEIVFWNHTTQIVFAKNRREIRKKYIGILQINLIIIQQEIIVFKYYKFEIPILPTVSLEFETSLARVITVFGGYYLLFTWL